MISMTQSSLPVEGDAHQQLVAMVANHCAFLFRSAGSHVSFPLDVLQLAAAGDCSKAGLLAAGMHARDLLASSPEGRKALCDLGFEPVFQHIEGE